MRPDAQINSLAIKANSQQQVRFARSQIEDIFRTELRSFGPAISRGLLVMRNLDLGSLANVSDAAQLRQNLSTHIRSAIQTAAKPFTSGAESAFAVYFDNPLDPYLFLFSETYNGRAVHQWHFRSVFGDLVFLDVPTRIEKAIEKLIEEEFALAGLPELIKLIPVEERIEVVLSMPPELVSKLLNAIVLPTPRTSHEKPSKLDQPSYRVIKQFAARIEAQSNKITTPHLQLTIAFELLIEKRGSVSSAQIESISEQVFKRRLQRAFKKHDTRKTRERKAKISPKEPVASATPVIENHPSNAEADNANSSVSHAKAEAIRPETTISSNTVDYDEVGEKTYVEVDISNHANRVEADYALPEDIRNEEQVKNLDEASVEPPRSEGKILNSDQRVSDEPIVPVNPAGVVSTPTLKSVESEQSAIAGSVYVIALMNHCFASWLNDTEALMSDFGKELLAHIIETEQSEEITPFAELLDIEKNEGLPQFWFFDPAFENLTLHKVARHKNWRMVVSNEKVVALYSGRAPSTLRNFIKKYSTLNRSHNSLEINRKDCLKVCKDHLEGHLQENDLTLSKLMKKPGWIETTPTHIDVVFDANLISLSVRRMALDTSPGWCRWLTRVVSIHYDFGGSHA